MVSTKEIKDSFLHLLFPHVCAGCGGDLAGKESQLCIRCMADLPETNFQAYSNNPVEKIFWGRLPLVGATAGYYFNKESLIRQLVHQFKYKGNKDLGLQLGRLMGKYLMHSGRFNTDALVPVPLFPVKERKRGYNQATVLCEGMAEIMNIPVLKNAVIRLQYTETQTRKGRMERWNNMNGKFVLRGSDSINGKHLVLVDDVLTTGATLEACGRELLKGEGVKLSVAALCISD